MFVRWAKAKRIHRISLERTKGVRYTETSNSFEARTPGQRLMTMCGEVVPDDHVGIRHLTSDQLNNELCGTCSRTRGM